MAAFDVHVKVCFAKDLKNVNWRNGDLRPYAVVWVDPSSKCSTRVAEDSDTHPVWDETLTIPVRGVDLDDATLSVDIVHAGAEEGTKPLVGSARLPLREVLDDVGFGEFSTRTLKLKRPSGRPHGKLELEVQLRQPYPPPTYARSSRDFSYPAYAPPPPAPYSAAPPTGYPYYQQPPPYGQPPIGYGQTSPAGYGQASPAVYVEEKKKSKFGVGTGLAVGAAAGLLGGLAIAEGVDYVEDKIADDVAEKVEQDLGYDDDFGGDDF